MGYRSTLDIRVKVTRKTGERSGKLNSELQELQRRAAELGAVVVDGESQENLVYEVQSWLDTHRDGIAYGLVVEPGHGDQPIVLSSDDGGKFYNFRSDFEDFFNFLSRLGLRVDGAVFRVGELNGDVQRLLVESGRVVSDEKGRVVFTDGTAWK